MTKTKIDHIFNNIEHRPWPLPNEKWQWQQTWEDLAFIHWEIDESQIRDKVPPQLEIDKYKGKAYNSVYETCNKLKFLGSVCLYF